MLYKIFFGILVILIVIVGIYYFSPALIISKPNTLTNTTELYSFFTPYMKDYVDTRLDYIDCQPTEYYYENNDTVCFICENMDACFGFVRVIREEGVKFNPLGEPYLKANKFDVRVADFYKDGLASYFNCKKISDNVLDCEHEISIILNGPLENITQNPLALEIRLKDKSRWNEVKDLICKKLRNSKCVETEEIVKLKELSKISYLCACQDMKIILFNNTIFYSGG